MRLKRRAAGATNTFFTTKVGWASKFKNDRNVFLTEDVYRALKEGEVSGPYCDRLRRYTPRVTRSTSFHFSFSR